MRSSRGRLGKDSSRVDEGRDREDVQDGGLGAGEGREGVDVGKEKCGALSDLVEFGGALKEIEGFGTVRGAKGFFVVGGRSLGLGRGRSRSSSGSDVVASSNAFGMGSFDGADLVVDTKGFLLPCGDG